LEDGKFVTCSLDKTIRIWSMDETIPEKILPGHTEAVSNMIILKSGRLCSASGDRTIKIWNMENATCEQTFSGYSGLVTALTELPNDILIGGGEDQIRFWNLRATDDEDACLRILSNKGYCRSIILISNEEMVCTSGKKINLFRIYGCDVPLKQFKGHRMDVRDLLLYPDRQHLLSSSEDKTLRMWNIHSGSCIRTFLGKFNCYRMVWFKEKNHRLWIWKWRNKVLEHFYW